MKSAHTTTDRCDPVPETPVPAPMVGNGVHTGRVVRLSSQAIFSGANEVEIEHHGALYRLRLTSLGKLILTK